MRSKPIWFTILLFWATAILVAYYVFHKPLDVQNLAALAIGLRSIGTAFGVISASAGLGRVIVRRLIPTDADGLDQLMVEFGVGFGFTGLLWLGLAVTGLLKVWVAWVALAAIIGGTFKSIVHWWRSLQASIRTFHLENRFQKLLGISIFILAVASLIEASAPPHAWDTLLYHLTSPLRHVQAGQLVIDSALPESGYPQLVEMHYTWLLLLGAPRAAALLHWFIGLLASLMVGSLARRWVNGQGSWIAVALIFSAGTWTKMMGVAYIDLVLVFFATLAFQRLIAWIEEPSAKKTILLGVLAGFGFGVKYTGAFVGVALALLMVWRRPRQAIRTMLSFGFGALIVSLPWLLKNLPMENPFYPFLGQGIGWDSIRQTWYSQVGSGLLNSSPSQLLLAPFIMTIVGAEGAETWHATFGPLMLMLAPALIVAWKTFGDKHWFRYGLAWIALLYGSWLYGAAISRLLIQPRLLFPLVPVLTLLLGAGAVSISELNLGRISLGRILNALIVFVLFLTIFNSVGGLLQDQTLEVVMGWQSSEDYLYQQLGWYHGAIRYLDSLPEGSRVLFLFEPRTYYCPGDICIPDGILDRWYWSRQRGLTNLEILEEWRQEGVTHVLVYQLGIELLQSGEGPMSIDDWNALNSLLQEQLIEVENFGNAYLLYQLPHNSAGDL
jgi:hypothetical protein